MAIHPILAALRKQALPATLIIVEIALACAVLCNAAAMIGQRAGAMYMGNAIDEDGIVVMNVYGAEQSTHDGLVRRNLMALRKIPFVHQVAAINMVPLSNGSRQTGVAAATPDAFSRKDNVEIGTYAFTQGGPSALELQLLYGRFFTPSQYHGLVSSDKTGQGGSVAIVTQSLANRLWPNERALGKKLWTSRDKSRLVIGVVKDVLLPASKENDSTAATYAAFVPVGPDPALHSYVIRTNPKNRNDVLRQAKPALELVSPRAVITGQAYTEIRDKYFAVTQSMIWMLLQAALAVLAVTTLTVSGLTSYWVRQRRRHVGIRRALGATRSSILYYFQVENAILTTSGLLIGFLFAYIANAYIMQNFAAESLPWYCFLTGAVIILLAGQIAAIGPALRAANLPPARVIKS
jgi:putative ABC transport system permease protein